MAEKSTLVDAIAAAMKDRGVARMFGIPGGGSSLDLIDAADRAGIEFVLTQTETAAVIMAAVTGELTGAPGVALAGIGPGAAASVNGMAYAQLEQAPVVLFTDCKHRPGSLHQAYDQQALFAPVSKHTQRLSPEDGVQSIDAVFDCASATPPGAVHIDLSASDAMAGVEMSGRSVVKSGQADMGDLSKARALLAASRRILIIVGLEARSDSSADALSAFVEGTGAAVMPTYKAKGVYPDVGPSCIGAFTGAQAEADCADGADLIVFYGVDPVEFIPGNWRYDAPIIEISINGTYQQPATPAARLIGPLAASISALGGTSADRWPAGELAELKRDYQARLSQRPNPRNADVIVQAMLGAAPAGTRLTVDAGAHMFSAMTIWQAAAPFGVLKSNGLSTMGFAVPAAIASAYCAPELPIAAITGDGGLLMTLGELATAARCGANMVIVVVNDAALSLIDIKQARQQRLSRGVRYPATDFAAAARAMGCGGINVGPDDDLDACLVQAFDTAGPVVVDIQANADGYGDQLAALRG